MFPRGGSTDREPVGSLTATGRFTEREPVGPRSASVRRQLGVAPPRPL